MMSAEGVACLLQRASEAVWQSVLNGALGEDGAAWHKVGSVQVGDCSMNNLIVHWNVLVLSLNFVDRRLGLPRHHRSRRWRLDSRRGKSGRRELRYRTPMKGGPWMAVNEEDQCFGSPMTVYPKATTALVPAPAPAAAPVQRRTASSTRCMLRWG